MLTKLKEFIQAYRHKQKVEQAWNEIHLFGYVINDEEEFKKELQSTLNNLITGQSIQVIVNDLSIIELTKTNLNTIEYKEVGNYVRRS